MTSDDKCVCCGGYVHEWSMVCPSCEADGAALPFSDYADSAIPAQYRVGYIVPDGAPWYVRLASKIVARWFDRQGA